MKKIITLFILFVATQIFAQNNGISYQAIILNPKGEQLPGVNNSTSPLANKNICMVFKFVDEFSNIEYQETIQTKTDGFGMVNLVIGSGNQTAGYATSFKDIVWNISKKSLSVGINTDGSCSNFTEISNQEFSYVPLAFSAINAENVTGVVAIENGGTNATTLLGAKTNLEINNVDNTSDLNKPISTATQTALSLKEVLSNKSTDLATDGDSDTKYPSVKSVKMYVDGKLLTSSNALTAEITRATTAENTIAANLATETTDRTSADATLTNNLAAEVTRATAAENAIVADLTTETTNRTSADATLTTNLTVEVTRAKAAENTIAADLVTETTNRIAADATLTTNLATEVTRATAAENTIVADLVTETTARASADATFTSNLAAEVTRATAAENTIAADLVTETTNRIATDATLTTNLATEVSRATAAENTIAADLATETTNRTSADATLTSNLATEVTRATTAENIIAADLATETTNRTSSDATLTSNLATEVTRATNAENTIATDLVTETTNRTSADATFTSNLAAEVSRATAAENIIAADLATETTNRTSADATLTSNLATEVTRATTAENIIAADLATETTNRTSSDATLTSNLATEVTRATNAENTIATDLVTETTDRTSADATFTSNLAAEVSRATAAENIIAADLATETTNRTSADATLTSNLATEVTRATTAENIIAADLATETTNRTSSDATLTSNLATEVTRATNAENTIATDLVTETTNRTSADATLQANINTVQADIDANELTTNNALALKVDKVSGKGLSTEDYTSAEKSKLAGITGTNTGDQDLSALATTSAMTTALGLKVDKVSGKGLSTEDYTSAEKSKLADITGINTGDQDISGIAINSTKIGDLSELTTTAQSNLVAAVNEIETKKAPLESPVFTGTPLASTAPTGTNTTQIATTAFVTTNFVDLTTNQTIEGSKSLSSNLRVGTTTPTTSAVLEVASTTQGFLLPRMTQTERNLISSPVAGLIVWCKNCGENGELQVFNGTKWTNFIGNDVQLQLVEGSNFKGGKIAYIFQSGDPGFVSGEFHGIIVSNSDLSNGVRWGQNYDGLSTTYDCTNRHGESGFALPCAIGAGSSNTALIIASNTEGSPTSYAAQICADYSITYNGVLYDDWFLPSYNEMLKIYQNKSSIGGLYYDSTNSSNKSNWYWTSTGDIFQDRAADVSSLNGSKARNFRGSLLSVRAARYF